MSASELATVIAAVGALVVSIGSAVASVVSALRSARVEGVINGHSVIMRDLAAAQGFTRGMAAERLQAGAVAVPVDTPVSSPPGTMGAAGYPPGSKRSNAPFVDANGWTHR